MSYTNFEPKTIAPHENPDGEQFIDPDNWSHVTAEEYINGDYESFDTALECVENYGAENNLTESETELSRRFDEMVTGMLCDMSYPNGEMFKNDAVALRELFNNWSDGLTKDGQLHSSQYSEYCYIGSTYDLED